MQVSHSGSHVLSHMPASVPPQVLQKSKSMCYSSITNDSSARLIIIPLAQLASAKSIHCKQVVVLTTHGAAFGMYFCTSHPERYPTATGTVVNQRNLAAFQCLPGSFERNNGACPSAI